jgi:penicillin-binding protein 1B
MRNFRNIFRRKPRDPHAPRPTWRKWAFRLSLVLGTLFIIALGTYVFFLAMLAKDWFAEKKWELPARVYARPLELFTGLELDSDDLRTELERASYRKAARIDTPGSYSRRSDTFTIFSRPFAFPDGEEPGRKIRLDLRGGRVQALSSVDTGDRLPLVRLDPALIGSFYPNHNEDRIWVRFDDLSPMVIQTILAVEDRDFYDHIGVKPMAILRALVANIRAGRTVQGGSTLTQQLVKNLFLDRRQTLRRKFDEAVMALSLEAFYDKDRIFEAYINEVYLGQDGKRAVHGFGLASRFYFNRALEDLRPKEMALLVGLLKGPSYYNPRRYPERARERRNVVLSVMEDLKLLRPDEMEAAKQSDLGVTPAPPSGTSPFPAFLELVQRRLLEEYREEDLRTEGLRIFTTLSPQVQETVNESVRDRLSRLERDRGLESGKLEAAVIVTSTGGNEVLALAGGRSGAAAEFNRALDARRSVGSLIKPVVYLAALERPDRYTLVTPLDDTEFRMNIPGQGVWSPANYDREYHGFAPLYRCLARSYNVATVRLGMELGLDAVFDTLRRLGVNQEFPEYPSALLGAISLSVLEMAQVYQTFAAGGFTSPVRAIEAVYRPDGEKLERYPLTVRESIDPAAVFLLNKALQAVVMEGTARRLNGLLPRPLGAAGKTGTTDELRDSWFAGFTGDRLAVVWVGRDDNKPSGLTGSSGALPVWADIMGGVRNTPLNLVEPGEIRWAVTDPNTGLRTDESCPGAVSIPFIAGSEPEEFISCDSQGNRRRGRSSENEKPGTLLDWLKDIF